MKLFLLFAVFTVIFTVEKVQGEKSCKEFITETIDKTMVSFFQCKKELPYKTDEERIKNMHCVLVCAMKKQSFLSPEGYVDETSLLSYVENQIPKSVQSRAIELMLKCQQFGETIDPEEPECLSYGGLLKCALSVVFKVCN